MQHMEGKNCSNPDPLPCNVQNLTLQEAPKSLLFWKTSCPEEMKRAALPRKHWMSSSHKQKWSESFFVLGRQGNAPVNSTGHPILKVTYMNKKYQIHMNKISLLFSYHKTSFSNKVTLTVHSYTVILKTQLNFWVRMYYHSIRTTLITVIKSLFKQLLWY